MSLRAVASRTPIAHGLLSFGLLVIACAPTLAASDRARSERAAAPAAAPAWPLIAIVSIGDQRVTIWSADGQLARSSVSTGMSGHRTPTGVFSVIGKERYHESNLYSNAPMPFMQRITWSGVALHEGHLPGYPASHGCIRMPGDFAQKLFGLTRTGMRVIITDRDVHPVAFTHPAMPTPTLLPQSQVASLVAPSRIPASFVLPASMASTTPGRMQLGGPAEETDRLLNPMERGKIEQSLVRSALLEARADTEALLQIATTRSAEARAAVQTRRLEEAAVVALSAGRDKANAALVEPSVADDDRARVELAHTTLDAALLAASQRLAAARQQAGDADAAAFAAAAEAKTAIAERDALEDAAKLAQRATEPVSVFISRRERKLYVRQGNEPILEAEVEITDPQDPLGTHVFTAVAAADDGSALSWLAVTLPDGVQRDEVRSRPGRGVSTSIVDRTTPALPATAANALSRVKIADDIRQKISEKSWVGASLIISDYRLSDETGKYTDFIVQTRSSSE